MRAKNEFKFISEAYQNVIKEETDEQIRRRGGYGDKDDPLWKRQMDNQPRPTPEELERIKNLPPIEKTGRLTQPKIEDNEEPKRGISGYEHKPDALVSARKAGAIHKPYVSSFVSDGGKIFGVMGSDGKIVHKTRDKQKAYKWLKDNYEDI